MSLHQDLRPYVEYDNTVFNNLLRSLEQQGITNIDQIANWSDEQLLCLKGIGARSVEIIRVAVQCKNDELARRKYRLRMDKERRKRLQDQIDELTERLQMFDESIAHHQKWIDKEELER